VDRSWENFSPLAYNSQDITIFAPFHQQNLNPSAPHLRQTDPIGPKAPKGENT